MVFTGWCIGELDFGEPLVALYTYIALGAWSQDCYCEGGLQFYRHEVMGKDDNDIGRDANLIAEVQEISIEAGLLLVRVDHKFFFFLRNKYANKYAHRLVNTAIDSKTNYCHVLIPL